jgi:hypothetical protein
MPDLQAGHHQRRIQRRAHAVAQQHPALGEGFRPRRSDVIGDKHRLQ